MLRAKLLLDRPLSMPPFCTFDSLNPPVDAAFARSTRTNGESGREWEFPLSKWRQWIIISEGELESNYYGAALALPMADSDKALAA